MKFGNKTVPMKKEKIKEGKIQKRRKRRRRRRRRRRKRRRRGGRRRGGQAARPPKVVGTFDSFVLSHQHLPSFFCAFTGFPCVSSSLPAISRVLLGFYWFFFPWCGSVFPGFHVWFYWNFVIVLLRVLGDSMRLNFGVTCIDYWLKVITFDGTVL